MVERARFENERPHPPVLGHPIRNPVAGASSVHLAVALEGEISAWWTSRSIMASATISSPKISPRAEKGLFEVRSRGRRCYGGSRTSTKGYASQRIAAARPVLSLAPDETETTFGLSGRPSDGIHLDC